MRVGDTPYLDDEGKADTRAAIQQRGFIDKTKHFASAYWSEGRSVVLPGGYASVWSPPEQVRPWPRVVCVVCGQTGKRVGKHLGGGLCGVHREQAMTGLEEVEAPGRHQARSEPPEGLDLEGLPGRLVAYVRQVIEDHQ